MKTIITCDSSEIKIALARKHEKDYYLDEVKSGSSWNGTANRILDGCALKCSYASPFITGYEIKVTRSDFKGDNKFFTYLPLVHALYIVTPSGLVEREELPTDIGLMWYDPKKKTLSVKKRPPPRQIEISVDMLLYIIYSRLDRERIPFYSSKVEFWRAWLEDKKSNRDLGRIVGGKMATEIARLAEELNAANSFRVGGEREEYKELRQILSDYGMPAWLINKEQARWLRERLTREYPECLDGVQRQLQTAIQSIEAEKAKATRDREKLEQVEEVS